MAEKTKAGAAASPPEVNKAKELSKALWAVFQGTIDGQIAGDRKHGWGAKDSLAVVESIVAEDASLSEAEKGKYTISDPAMKLIAEVINPSAFRQQLEKAKRLDVVENKRNKGLAGLEAEFNS